MPRPGPRPYECVKRAWHSDRHRPLRGSIIQQIFRVVHERHSSVTKKNKEWQEKLPIVVLKAEEIMYSKANSEAEYLDLQTLWDRVNDAVDTIIRRDASTESGDLLPPCVEAALNLGCIPVRASRSQRHANPQSYLSPRPRELPNVMDNAAQEQNSQPLSLQKGNQSTVLRPLVNSAYLVAESNTQGMQRNNRDKASISCNSQLLPLQMGNQSIILRPAVNSPNLVAESNFQGMRMNIRDNVSTSCSFISPSSKVPSSNNQFIPPENSISLDVSSVYPAQYVGHFRHEMPPFGFHVPKNTNSVIVGTPIFPQAPRPAVMGSLQNLFSCEREELFSNKFAQADIRNKNEMSHGSRCDLSLRLGFSEDSTESLVNVPNHGFRNVGASSSKEAEKSSLLPHQNKEFSFFPVETANDPFMFQTSRWNSEGEGQNARKR